MNPSELIDKQIKEAGGWKGEKLAKLREIIHQADPEIVEEWKWETAVFTHKGMVCAISPFKEHIKINFFKGALLPDPEHIINGGLESKQHRSIDFKEGDIIPEQALHKLISSATAYNQKK